MPSTSRRASSRSPTGCISPDAPELQAVWRAFGEEVSYEPGGAMVDHSEFAYSSTRGHTREILNTDPGPATSATQSSFTVTLADALKSALRS